MYLIHAALRAPSAGVQLPAHAGELVRAFADADAATGAFGSIEHVSAHPGALPGPTLGVYLIADSLDDAERRTEALCRRAFEEVPALRGWTVGRVGMPLVTPYYERLLGATSGLPGRKGPGPVPST
ncbi:hypothetical protein [Streptomyces sp. NBC_00503]|uniref:hypothetical protein n=1 Tax=Streptomyces sp. NBC_00503 TaxID=2903659 RepID=UPI002E809F0B|nr:hypothetical protein [Streptomyces sp. NBC_00503]WUD82005.1 hypothetical protein OG490_16445 [Streptomyces sp. NBC_00503]